MRVWVSMKGEELVFEGVSSTRGRPKREPSDVKSSKNFIGAWMFFAICDRPCTA